VADLETPSDFIHRLQAIGVGSPGSGGWYPSALLTAIKERDAAVRSETRAELIAELRRMADDPHQGATTRALREAADWLEAMAKGE
jgi:hypothetical protein